MIRTTASLLGLLAFAACSDGSGGGAIGGGGSMDDVPDELKINVEAVSYSPATETLTLRMSGLDGGPQDLTYERNRALDVEGYEAYTFQADPLDRHFTAMVAESDDGSVMAGAVIDGGQFNRYFGGGFYQRRGTFDAPRGDGGLVSYAGTYAGGTNIDAVGDDLLPVTGNPDPAIRPAQANRIEGDIFLNVSFADNAINGAIYNRRLVENPATTLPALALIRTDITEDGTFTGDVEFDVATTNTIGTYGGIFGGRDSSSVGGAVFLEDVDNAEYNWTADNELGVFVLSKCGQAGDAPQCADAE